jgi:hypothetical protein
MEVNDHIHDPAALSTSALYHWIGGRVGPRAGINTVERRKILYLTGIEHKPFSP